MKPINPNLHALAPNSTPLDIGTDFVPNDDIVFSNRDGKQVLKITKDENKKLICEWGEGITHWINLNHLDSYLTDLISTDLKNAIIRELKLKMNNSVKKAVKEVFNLEEG